MICFLPKGLLARVNVDRRGWLKGEEMGEGR
jgi:hypothetical protein